MTWFHLCGNQLAHGILLGYELLRIQCKNKVTDSVPPSENQLVSMLHNEKRFYDFGCRTQINYPNLSVLIKNMPIDDMERYGRIKDILPAMIGTVNNRIISLLRGMLMN